NSLLDAENPLWALSNELGNMIGPQAKIPAELMLNRRMFNGQPIDGDYFNYFSSQLPQTRMASGQGSPASFGRAVTGIPLVPITESMMNNEAYRREQEARRLFNNALSKNLPDQYKVLDEDGQRKAYRQL